MTIQKVCQNFSEYSEYLQLLSTNVFPDLIEIYLKSIVPEDLLYDQFIIMSARTSNNYDIIKDMPFNKFNKLSKALNRYIDAENKRENGENPDVQKQSEEMMSNQRNMMNQMKSSFKMPKMSKFK